MKTDISPPADPHLAKYFLSCDESSLDLTFLGQNAKESCGCSHPQEAGADLKRGKQQCPDPSLDAFIFPNKDGDFMDTGNYRKRVLLKLATDLKLSKLTFQVIRRTIATLAQKKGTVKIEQGVLRHARAATTTDCLHATDPQERAGDGRFDQRGVKKKVQSQRRRERDAGGTRGLPLPNQEEVKEFRHQMTPSTKTLLAVSG